MEPIEKTEGGRAVVMSYTPVSDERKEASLSAKALAAAYYNAICACEEQFGRHRDFSLAKTKLQEASMWLTRGLMNPE